MTRLTINDVLFHYRFVLARVFLGFILVQNIGVTNAYSQDKIDILEVKYRVLKTDYRLNGEETSYQGFIAVLAVDNIAYKKWQFGRALKAVGNIIIIPSTIIFGLGIANMNSDDDIAGGLAPVMMLGGLGGAIIGITLIVTGKNKTLNAIDIFNSKNRVHLDLLNNGTKLGIVIGLNKR